MEPHASVPQNTIWLCSSCFPPIWEGHLQCWGPCECAGLGMWLGMDTGAFTQNPPFRAGCYPPSALGGRVAQGGPQPPSHPAEEMQTVWVRNCFSGMLAKAPALQRRALAFLSRLSAPAWALLGRTPLPAGPHKGPDSFLGTLYPGIVILPVLCGWGPQHLRRERGQEHSVTFGGLLGTGEQFRMPVFGKGFFKPLGSFLCL